jgi:hypothetical protein
MQYLTELVQQGLGVSILPPMSLRAVTPQVRRAGHPSATP